MLVNETIRKAFVKDFSLPISIFEEEHFFYALQQLNKYYNSIQYFKYLTDYLTTLQSASNTPDESFIGFNKKIIDSSINIIKTNEAYNDFINMDMTQYNHNLNITKSNQLYKSYNDGKTFISVDLVKANFQALKFVNPDIVLNLNSYHDFISKFSNFDYHLKSKK